ncbi:unnamed protein product [Ceratitis capitata]|uniref:(Mediterranean fruit fly) hypothetical protein n=1 Tax=Ceratitis capitata TaxID=7213 RepID=A0A811UNB1_CERCA|nr:unnamed protein product [Ceratitis capitata]
MLGKRQSMLTIKELQQQTHQTEATTWLPEHCQDALKHETFVSGQLIQAVSDIKRALKGFDSGIDGRRSAKSPRGMQPCSPSGVIAVMPPSKSPTMETAAGQQANVHVGSDENACEKEQQQRAATPINTTPTTNTNTTATTTHLTNARACPLKFSIAKIMEPDQRASSECITAGEDSERSCSPIDVASDECESERAEMHLPSTACGQQQCTSANADNYDSAFKKYVPSASANTAAAVTAAAVAANTVTNVAAVQQFVNTRHQELMSQYPLLYYAPNQLMCAALLRNMLL